MVQASLQDIGLGGHRGVEGLHGCSCSLLLQEEDSPAENDDDDDVEVSMDDDAGDSD